MSFLQGLNQMANSMNQNQMPGPMGNSGGMNNQQFQNAMMGSAAGQAERASRSVFGMTLFFYLGIITGTHIQG